MEVKLSLRQPPLSDLRLPLLLRSKSNLSSHSLLWSSSCAKSERPFQKRISGAVKKWRLRIQEISDSQRVVKHYSVHVVKEGETLTSIAKQYGVSVYAIAVANKNIEDIDLLYQGHRLQIPSLPEHAQAVWSGSFKLPKKIHGCLNISNGGLQMKKSLSLLCSRLVPDVYPSHHQARAAASFLFLVPLVAFCVRCIVGAIRARAAHDLRRQVMSDPGVSSVRQGGERWRSALGEAWGPDVMEGGSVQDSTVVQESDIEDQRDQISPEEDYHAYRKLETDYQEFLGKCGMSKFGYWRGGSPR